MSLRYHYTLGFPNIQLPQGILRLTYGAHAKDAAQRDPIGPLTLPDLIHFSHCKIVELETENGKLSKLVVRVAYSTYTDLCLVVNPDGFVRTIWTNQKDDAHKTLKRELYTIPVKA